MATQLEEGGVSLLSEMCDRGSESHRFAHILPPIVGVEFRPREEPFGDGRVEGDLRLPGRQANEGGQERFSNGIHLHAVECVIDRHSALPAATKVQLRGDFAENARIAGKRHGVRAVDRSHTHIMTVRRNQRPCLVFRQRRRQHATVGRDTIHGVTAMVNHLHGRIQVEDSRHIGGSNFADTVSDDGGRPNAPVSPQRCQRDLERENRGLGDRCIVHP